MRTYPSNPREDDYYLFIEPKKNNTTGSYSPTALAKPWNLGIICFVIAHKKYPNNNHVMYELALTEQAFANKFRLNVRACTEKIDLLNLKEWEAKWTEEEKKQETDDNACADCGAPAGVDDYLCLSCRAKKGE